MQEQAAQRWRDELAAWAIPDEILAAAPESPWGFPPALWRAGETESDESLSRQRALEALGAGGDVLDVGCGGGRAGLSLVPAAKSVVGVDESEEMLSSFSAAAQARGVLHSEVLGAWPDVAPEVGQADVVVCHHVAYNVPLLAPFVVELNARARRRVVLELTERHPLVALAPLWERFHGLERPAGPTADLAYEVLVEAGIEPVLERFATGVAQPSRELVVAFNRRRLCLPASRDAEVDEALGQDGGSGRELVTLWWDT